MASEQDNVFYKDPGAKLPFGVEWEDWLATGDEIASASWTVPSGLTGSSDSHTTTLCQIWLDGGTDGLNYTVTCAIVTDLGYEDERDLEIWCRERPV